VFNRFSHLSLKRFRFSLSIAYGFVAVIKELLANAMLRESAATGSVVVKAVAWHRSSDAITFSRRIPQASVLR
jgi:divalent metal cation (Fe/Co/Zn/Cd) transporter